MVKRTPIIVGIQTTFMISRTLFNTSKSLFVCFFLQNSLILYITSTQIQASVDTIIHAKKRENISKKSVKPHNENVLF